MIFLFPMSVDIILRFSVFSNATDEIFLSGFELLSGREMWEGTFYGNGDIVSISGNNDVIFARRGNRDVSPNIFKALYDR